MVEPPGLLDGSELQPNTELATIGIQLSQADTKSFSVGLPNLKRWILRQFLLLQRKLRYRLPCDRGVFGGPDPECSIPITIIGKKLLLVLNSIENKVNRMTYFHKSFCLLLTHHDRISLFSFISEAIIHHLRVGALVVLLVLGQQEFLCVGAVDSLIWFVHRYGLSVLYHSSDTDTFVSIMRAVFKPASWSGLLDLFDPWDLFGLVAPWRFEPFLAMVSAHMSRAPLRLWVHLVAPGDIAGKLLHLGNVRWLADGLFLADGRGCYIACLIDFGFSHNLKMWLNLVKPILTAFMQLTIEPKPIRSHEDWLSFTAFGKSQLLSEGEVLLLERSKVVCRDCFGFGHSKQTCPTAAKLDKLRETNVLAKSAVGQVRAAVQVTYKSADKLTSWPVYA